MLYRLGNSRLDSIIYDIVEMLRNYPFDSTPGLYLLHLSDHWQGSRPELCISGSCLALVFDVLGFQPSHIILINNLGSYFSYWRVLKHRFVC
jgi:hypothetical protein